MQTKDEYPAFNVSVENFDGPFDLLLALISKHKLDLTEISLSKVTGEFAKYIALKKDLNISADFVVVLSILLNVKVAQLLDYTDEEVQYEDMDLLFARLLQYSAFRKIGHKFDLLLKANELYYPRIWTPKGRTKELQLDVSRGQLYDIYQRLNQSKRVDISTLHVEKVDLGQQRHLLIDRLKAQPKMTFWQIVEDVKGKPQYIVARFLLLLELFKENRLALKQHQNFGKLEVIWEK